jgi:uncharacterized membrane protein HdeD (DUF308 family)
MRDFWQHLKMDYLLSSLMCIILGIIFIVYKGGVVNVLGMAIAILLIVFGGIMAGSFLLNLATNGFAMFAGMLILAAGVWFLLMPSVVVSVIPVVIGILLLSHGIRAIKESVSAHKYGYSSMGLSIVLGIVSIVCGVICIFDAFGVMENAIMLVGIILVFNGLSNIWVSMRVSHAEREYSRLNDPLDVEFRD